jgi:putative holliday junction resolvase
MARIMGIDYGLKRIGIAVTDPLQIIASPLDTVSPDKIFDFIKNYLFTEEIECFVIGEPKRLDDTDADIMPQIRTFAKRLNELFPQIKTVWQDERFTSREAQQIIIQSGIKKMKRRDKTLVDKVSASLILKDWMISTGKWLV